MTVDMPLGEMSNEFDKLVQTLDISISINIFNTFFFVKSVFRLLILNLYFTKAPCVEMSSGLKSDLSFFTSAF